ncbi:MAG: hypothetical protein EON91_11195 [Brevundimonas sp.]|nr:MAG: hypothetical protein EON91_11195 [Brevundimonas sp.]
MTLGEWLNSMIMEDGEDEDGVVPMPRRAHAADTFDRRGRARRLDDAYDVNDPYHRLNASIEAIAGRLEAAERRSTVAIQGVDQAVSGLVRRLEEQDARATATGRRLDDIAEELREGHRRLRRFENDTGPKTEEGFKALETSLGALTGRLYDIEERQRVGATEVRLRMDTVEKSVGAGAGTTLLGQVAAKLDAAQSRTTDALRGLERSFGDLDRRLRATESRAEPEGARFEKLAETLARQVESNRAEMMRRLDTAQADSRMDRIERAVQTVGDKVALAERGSARAVEAMGREVLRIAQNLNGRLQKAEDHTRRVEQAVDQRLMAADDRHALALEKLGGEITRISDRLSDRIAQSERRSAQALEDIGQRLSDSSSRFEQRYDRTSGELAERMRQSEERTARLLAEARDSIEVRGQGKTAPIPTVAEPVIDADWRAAAFPEDSFGDDWGGGEPGLQPFPGAAPETSPTPVVAETIAPAPRIETPAFGAPAPFAAFGGADVSDALEATDADFIPAQAPAPVASPLLESDGDAFAAETDFVTAPPARSASTRETLDAARAAMGPKATAASVGFGLKRGGKSRLQERLDKQAAKDGATVRKALLASVTAVVLTGGALAFDRLTDGALDLPGLSALAEEAPTAELLALSLTPVDASADPAQANELYLRAQDQMTAGEPEGVKTLTRAAELGQADAALELAGLYQTGGSGVTVDLAESRLWARRAAEGGAAKGMHAYAMYLFDGVGGARNRPEALSWLNKAAGQGLVDSQYNVARLYENGDEGIAVSLTDAFKWYLIAARAGDPQAGEAVQRLTPTVPAAQQRAARAAAEAFKVEPQV